MIRTASSNNDFLCLARLLGGYFHQDYDIISDDFRDIVRVFKEDSSVSERACTLADIRRFLLRFGQAEDSLEKAFATIFSPAIVPAGWGLTTRQWLDEVAFILAESEAATAP